jgi:hypothetical protein
MLSNAVLKKHRDQLMMDLKQWQEWEKEAIGKLEDAQASLDRRHVTPSRNIDKSVDDASQIATNVGNARQNIENAIECANKLLGIV